MADSLSRGVKLDLVFLDEIADAPSEQDARVILPPEFFDMTSSFAIKHQPSDQELAEFFDRLSGRNQ